MSGILGALGNIANYNHNTTEAQFGGSSVLVLKKNLLLGFVARGRLVSYNSTEREEPTGKIQL